MDAASRSTFRTRVLASRLVTREQLDEAINTQWPEAEGGPKLAEHLADEQLAKRLVETKLLNRWQTDQLLAGRSRFHLGPYRILSSIGQGGMGQVFKAEHTIMGRIVAIKVLPKHKSTPEAITGFMREIRAQAKVDHGNLVRALDAGHDGNVHYLVTEYVPGTDLRRLVRRQGRLSMNDAASIISQAAIGLEHAHEIGLIHRDVKPGNILVTPDGRAKVSDLGLIAFLNNDPAGEWQKGKIVGTADYLSPEQIKSPECLTPASDIYSLGCTLYYTVTGKVPFAGGSTKDKALAHCRSQPLDPRRLNPDLTEGFVEVIAAMMEKDPSKRLSSMTAVAARLSPWIGSERPVLSAAALSGSFSTISVDNPYMQAQDLPSAPSLSDTQPSFDFGPHPPSQGDESPSQSSQGTQPVASASDETLPAFSERERLSKLRELVESSLDLPDRWQRTSKLSPSMMSLIVLGAAAVAAAALAILISMA